jgi:hypothetical protein
MILGRRTERWTLTAIAVAFAIGGALETGLVVAQWAERYDDQRAVEVGQVCAALGAGWSQAAEPAYPTWPPTLH